MNTSKAIEHFGSQAALASALHVSQQAVTGWIHKGILPIGRAYQLQVITDGKLKVDQSLYGEHAAA